MKKIIIVCFFCIYSLGAYAIDLTLTYHDSGWYSVSDPTYASLGELTAISDIYYYFQPFDGMLKIVQTDWIADGKGGEYVGGTGSFSYNNVTFDWLKSYTSELWLNERPFYELKNQFDNWVQSNVFNISNLSIVRVSNDLLKQHNIDIYKSVFKKADINKKTKFSVWNDVWYNSMKNTGLNNYKGSGLNVAFGTDIKLLDKLLFGFGYSYSNVDIDLKPNYILFSGNNLFLYSKWEPNNFYIKNFLSYDFSNYDYFDGLYNGNVYTFFGNIVAGYSTKLGIRPEVGIRYMNIEINQENDFFKNYKNNFYSFNTSLDYEYKIGDFGFGGTVLVDYSFFKPGDNIRAEVLGYKYNFYFDENIRPLSAELGIWTKYNIDYLSINLSYDMRIQSDFISHTFGFSLNYCF